MNFRPALAVHFFCGGFAFRIFLLNEGKIHHRRHENRDTGRRANRPQGTRQLPDQQNHRQDNPENHQQIQPFLIRNNRDRALILQQGGNVPVILSEKHKVCGRRNRQHREHRREDPLRFVPGQAEIDPAPQREKARCQQKRVKQIAGRIQQIPDIQKFLDGRLDHIGRDQQARQHRQEGTAEPENAFALPRRDPGRTPYRLLCSLFGVFMQQLCNDVLSQ